VLLCEGISAFMARDDQQNNAREHVKNGHSNARCRLGRSDAATRHPLHPEKRVQSGKGDAHQCHSMLAKPGYRACRSGFFQNTPSAAAA